MSVIEKSKDFSELMNIYKRAIEQIDSMKNGWWRERLNDNLKEAIETEDAEREQNIRKELAEMDREDALIEMVESQLLTIMQNGGKLK